MLDECALQRKHDLREVYNGLRWLVRTGGQWRMLPHDFPRWERRRETVYQRTRRARAARGGQPSAVILDARAVQSTPGSGAGAGYDGHERRKGRKVHLAMDTLGHLLATVITAANEQGRAQVAELAALVQQVTGQTVELAYVARATLARNPPQPPLHRASNSRSSSCPTPTAPSAALSCCHAAGWWSGASLGWPASAAWRTTMSACLKRWRADVLGLYLLDAPAGNSPALKFITASSHTL